MLILNFIVDIAVGGRCVSPDEYTGTCIELEKCESIKKLRYKTPQNHIDRLYVSLSQCGFIDNKVLVCCSQSPYPNEMKLSNVMPTRYTTKPPGTQPQFQTYSGKKPPSVPLSIRNPNQNFECAGILNNRIYGGSEAKINEMPFTALLSYSRSGSFSRLAETKPGFYCGGALISENSVLTGAHCVNEAILKSKSWTLNGVRLGEWNLQTNPDCDEKNLCAPLAVDLAIAKTIVHESFVPFSVDQSNDIAIVKLAGTVEFNDFVKPICLPDSSSYLQNFDGVPLIVAGFGKTETGAQSNIKLRTEIRGVSNAACKKLYDGQPQQIYPTQLCVLGDDGNDSW